MSAAAGGVIPSARERGLVEFVAQGLSKEEIAARLGLQRKTVESNLSRLFNRFGGLSRKEFAMRAEQDAWLEIE